VHPPTWSVSLHKMEEESKLGPYDLQQAVAQFIARRVGLPTVRMALERRPESVEGVLCTVSRSRGEWARLKLLHDSAIGATLFSGMTIWGTLLRLATARGSESCYMYLLTALLSLAAPGDALKKKVPMFRKMKRLALQRTCRFQLATILCGPYMSCCAASIATAVAVMTLHHCRL